MIYELRTYITEPGQLHRLHRRFREHTLGLFEKHGISSIGYWEPEGEPDTLIYLLAHPGREEGKANWRAFREDQEWIEARAASEREGKIVARVISQWLRPTDYSALT